MSKVVEVMVIDDEEIVGRRLKPAIEKMGCRVEAFLDPVAALARLDEKEFDIVVTDVRMDEIDGIQVLEHAKKKSQATEVIIITGYAMMALAREAMQKGAFDFLAKPFKPNDLRSIILKAVKKLGYELDYTLPEASSKAK
jgi:DNA-binding NtrC family response regulator